MTATLRYNEEPGQCFSLPGKIGNNAQSQVFMNQPSEHVTRIFVFIMKDVSH